MVVGDRVRVNESFPYGSRGREGTVIALPDHFGGHVDGGWLQVRFDDDGTVAKWHKCYFDLTALEKEDRT